MKKTSPAKPPVRVLHLEDNENDHVLVKELFAAEGLHCEFELAQDRKQFEAALQRGKFDLIISDFSLPSYDGSRALSIARKLYSDVPFIFFSGTIGEETAVDSLKIGATDFVIKQRPKRLVAAVRRALQEAEDRASREEMEVALLQTEERFLLIARATNDVIWEWNIPANKIWFSENFQAAFGHQPEKNHFASEIWTSLLHPDDRERVSSSISSMLATGGRAWWGEYRLRRANNSHAQVFTRAFATYDAAGKPLCLVGVTIDMTERKTAEAKIQEQAALLDKAGDAILVCDMESRVQFWNRSAERIYGWKAEEVIGRKTRELFYRELPTALEDAQKQLLERGEWIGEMHHLTKSGNAITVASRWTLVRDNLGQPKSRLVFNTDITEMKNLESQLLRAQRVESLGFLVSGIAHDLNNTLVPVLMGVGFLQSVPLPPEAAGILNTMRISATRGADMVKHILAFARGGEGKKDLVQADKLLKEMGRIITDTFPKSIECKTEIAPDCWAVCCFATQLHQIIMNLCVNARDAMPKGGTLKLSAKNVVLDSKQAAQHPEARPGQYLCLAVRDSGVGIPKEQVSQIFQPFFTTKPLGKGTGLGLSTSLTIAKNHGGFITVDSAPGRGSEFKVFLPAAMDSAPAEPMPASAPLPAGNGETVLVVDDESAILAIVKTALENYGYHVLTATSGPEAVAKLSEQPDAVQLVITDVGMPFMDGASTVKALRKIKPGLKIIVASGLENENAADTGHQIKCEAFIGKPFTVETLVTTVHEALAAQPRG